MLVSSLERAEQALAAEQLRCPGCGGVLRPFGYARRRTVRGLGAERLTLTPRRSRCADCWASHVLLGGLCGAIGTAARLPHERPLRFGAAHLGIREICTPNRTRCDAGCAGEHALRCS